MTDVFAGRIYEWQPSDAMQAFRRLMARERTYGLEDDCAVPIGSRHHSERARIWNADDAAVGLTDHGCGASERTPSSRTSTGPRARGTPDSIW